MALAKFTQLFNQAHPVVSAHTHVVVALCLLIRLYLEPGMERQRVDGINFGKWQLKRGKRVFLPEMV